MPILADSPRASHGFTLTELLCAVAVVAALAAVATPGLARLLLRHRLATIGNDMLGLAIVARREALHRGVRVTLCRSDDPLAALPRCAGPGVAWNEGVLVFVDDGATTPPQPASRADLLRIRAPISAGYSLNRRGLTTAAISFAPSGRLKSGTVGVSFDIAAPGAAADTPTGERRCFLIATTGRARVDDQPCA